MAPARRTAAAISSRYDIVAPPPDELLRGGAEHLVFAGIARHGREEVAVQLRDEVGQCRAPPVGQPGFPDVLRRCLLGVKAQRFPLVQLEDEREEAVAERFDLAAGARDLCR